MTYYNNNGRFTTAADPLDYGYDTLNDFGKWIAQQSPKKKDPEVKLIEYAFKDEVDYLRRSIDKMETEVVSCLQGIDINRKDCEQIYQMINVTRIDIQNLTNYVDYLHRVIKEAPVVAKRKRRVTICANGQRVEVYRHD